MVAPVVIAHDDPEFLRNVEATFRSIGIEPAAFQSSIAALEAVERADTVRVLVTRDNFSGRGDPNGISLLMVARRRVPDLKAVFVCSDATRHLAADYGVAFSEPVAPTDIVQVVQQLLD